MARDNTKPPVFMQIIATAEELWHERKGLDYTTGTGARKRIVVRMHKKVEDLKGLIEMLPQEFEVIDWMYLKNDDNGAEPKN